jgi:hypothetical protein
MKIGTLYTNRNLVRCALVFFILFIFHTNTKAQTCVSLVSGGGNFTVPASVTSMTVYCWGGGGGGGSGVNSGAAWGNGGGGGGGACAVSTLVVAAGQVYTITYGAGGTGAAAGNNPGGNGGSTTVTGVGGTVTGAGGSGGLGSNAAGGAHAGGSTLGGSVGGTIYLGGTGSSGNDGTGVTGTGGGGAGSGGAGSNATAGCSGSGGAGGAGTYTGGTGGYNPNCSSTTNLTGITGATPGGGGSGGDTYTTNSAGGAGGAGKVEICYCIYPAAIGGGAASVCVGGTTPAFTDATGGGTWSITNGTGSATISAGGVVTGVSAGSVTVNYAVIAGCAATYALTINPLPVVAAIGGGAASVCPGATTPAFTDATGGGTWSITNGTGTATISAGGIVTGVTAGSVTVNYAVTNACGTTIVTYALTVTGVAAIQNGSSSVCVGSTTGVFTDATFGGTWSITNGTGSATINSQGNVTGVSVGTATVKYTVTTACGATTVSYPITVVSGVPVVAAIGGGANPICGTAAAFTDATAGGTWSITNGTGSASIDAAGVVTEITAGTATVNYAVTNACGTTTVTYAITLTAGCIGTTAGCNIITSSGNWTVPAGVTTATVYCIGGGGGGGGGATGTWYGDGGGGGGGASASSVLAVSAGQVYVCTVGAAGNGGAAGNNAGTAGGASTVTGVGGTVIGVGGAGGAGSAGTSGVSSAGGAGGAAGSCTGTTTYSGGSGSNGYDGTSGATGYTGTGGGGAGSGGAGTTPANGCGGTGTGGAGTYTGGTGGYNTNCNVHTNNSGTAGTVPGGGGSGDDSWSSSTAGSNGGGGEVIICYCAPCSGTPTAGAAFASVTASCAASYASLISLVGATTSCGVTYQWQSSTDNNTWSNIAGATSSTYNATVTSSTYYTCVITCTSSGLTGSSSSTYCQLGPAANDACSSPVAAGVVTNSSPYSVYSNNLCATLNTGSADPASSCGGVGVGTMWYTFTTPSYSSSYTVTVVPASMTFAGVAVYSSTCGSFAQVGCSYPATTSGIPAVAALSCLTANTTYYVMVYCNGTAGDFFLNVTAPACSAGNTEATVLTQCAAGAYASTMSLINTGGCITGYQWQSSPDNTTWTNVAGATSSTYAASINSNIYYHCIVTCSDGSTSTSTSEYCSAPGSAPANDVCASAISMTFVGGINSGDYIAKIQGDNTCATADGTSQCFAANKSVWYKFTAPVAGSYYVGVDGGTMTLPELSVYTGTCAGFTEQSCAGAKSNAGVNSSYDSYSAPPYTLGYSPYSVFGGDPDQFSSPYNHSEAGVCNLAAGQTAYVLVDNSNITSKYLVSGGVYVPCNSSCFSGCGSGCGGITVGPGTAGTFTLIVATVYNDNVPNGVIVNSCGSIFNSSTIGATNCGNGVGDGAYNNLDNSNSTYCNGSTGASCGTAGAAGNACAAFGTAANGGDVGYSVENDSWYQFCVVATSTVTLNFSPVAASCLPTAANGGSGSLQIALFTGTSAALTKLNGGFCSQQVSTTFVTTFTLAANNCCFVEVDGFAGTNCDYQLAITMTPNCVLPVEILSFSGVLQPDLSAKLNWVTASENDADYYLIERSSDNMQTFTEVGRKKAKGNSTIQTVYEMFDRSAVKGTNFYKLSIVDKNGIVSFLGYATVSNRAGLSHFNLYPNPAQNNITLGLSNFTSDKVNYELYDARGILVKSEVIQLIDGGLDYSLDISALPKGLYFIKLAGTDEVMSKTFIKSE